VPVPVWINHKTPSFLCSLLNKKEVKVMSY
jgi:hypothetical protein